MTTMAKAIRAFLEERGDRVTSDQIRRHINQTYPDRWKESTFTAHLYGCAVNQPKAYVHHPSTEKFLYRNADGTFELYSEAVHGPNEWAPTTSDDETADVAELAETSISLERDLEDHLVQHLEGIEEGLSLVGRQVTTDVGRIDILAEDAQGRRVIIEVKVGAAKDSAVGQIARYLGWYKRAEGAPPRGLLVAASFPEGVRYAAEAVSNLTLLTYRVQFLFEKTAVEE